MKFLEIDDNANLQSNALGKSNFVRWPQQFFMVSYYLCITFVMVVLNSLNEPTCSSSIFILIDGKRQLYLNISI